MTTASALTPLCGNVRWPEDRPGSPSSDAVPTVGNSGRWLAVNVWGLSRRFGHAVRRRRGPDITRGSTWPCLHCHGQQPERSERRPVRGMHRGLADLLARLVDRKEGHEERDDHGDTEDPVRQGVRSIARGPRPGLWCGAAAGSQRFPCSGVSGQGKKARRSGYPGRLAQGDCGDQGCQTGSTHRRRDPCSDQRWICHASNGSRPC